MFIKELINSKGGFIHPSAIINNNIEIKHPIHLSKNVEVHSNCVLGQYVFINVNTIVYSNVQIGSYCTFARNCEIGVASHPIDWLSTNSFQYNNKLFPSLKSSNVELKKYGKGNKTTKIGSDVWLGSKVIVLNGVTIGTGFIVAANSVVTKDIEAYSIAGGSPAKLIRMRFSESIINELLRLKWWELSALELNGVSFDNIEKAIEEIKEIKQKRMIEK